jgi:hypothetical protein
MMKLSFRFQKVVADRVLRWTTTIACIRCGRPVTVTRGETHAVLRGDRELIGVVCPECLSPQSRARLATLRAPEMQP